VEYRFLWVLKGPYYHHLTTIIVYWRFLHTYRYTLSYTYCPIVPYTYVYCPIPYPYCPILQDRIKFAFNLQYINMSSNKSIHKMCLGREGRGVCGFESRWGLEMSKTWISHVGPLTRSWDPPHGGIMNYLAAFPLKRQLVDRSH
jgi:hypothetical protein